MIRKLRATPTAMGTRKLKSESMKHSTAATEKRQRRRVSNDSMLVISQQKRQENRIWKKLEFLKSSKFRTKTYSSGSIRAWAVIAIRKTFGHQPSIVNHVI